MYMCYVYYYIWKNVNPYLLEYVGTWVDVEAWMHYRRITLICVYVYSSIAAIHEKTTY